MGKQGYSNYEKSYTPLLWDRLRLLISLLCWLSSLSWRPQSRGCCFCLQDRQWSHADCIHHFRPNLQHLCCLQAGQSVSYALLNLKGILKDVKG